MNKFNTYENITVSAGVEPLTDANVVVAGQICALGVAETRRRLALAWRLDTDCKDTNTNLTKSPKIRTALESDRLLNCIQNLHTEGLGLEDDACDANKHSE